MIDYSNEIFTEVANDLRFLYPGIQVKGEYVDSPATFPVVAIDEIQNIPTYLDTAATNKYARIVYRSQIFCNGEGKRRKAREIFNSLDQKLMSMGLFVRSYTTTPTIYNAEVYCITATHEGVIGADGTIYRG